MQQLSQKEYCFIYSNVKTLRYYAVAYDSECAVEIDG